VEEVISGTIVISIHKEFESIPVSDLDFIFANAPPKARPAFRALPWDAALDALDPVRRSVVDVSERLSDPDAESVGCLLEEGMQQIGGPVGEISWIHSSALRKNKAVIRPDPVVLVSARLAWRSGCGGKKKLTHSHSTTLTNTTAHCTEGLIDMVR
jgi:hypothetical protein